MLHAMLTASVALYTFMYYYRYILVHTKVTAHVTTFCISYVIMNALSLLHIHLHVALQPFKDTICIKFMTD